MKITKNILSCFSLILFIAFSMRVESYQVFPLKNLFNVLKIDDIGFGQSLLHSYWIENIYEYGPGERPSENNKWKGKSASDFVVDLVRFLWFRRTEKHSLLPTNLLELSPEDWGQLINLSYLEFNKINIEVSPEVKLFVSVKKKIKKIDSDLRGGRFGVNRLLKNLKKKNDFLRRNTESSLLQLAGIRRQEELCRVLEKKLQGSVRDVRLRSRDEKVRMVANMQWFILKNKLIQLLISYNEMLLGVVSQTVMSGRLTEIRSQLAVARVRYEKISSAIVQLQNLQNQVQKLERST